MFGAHGRVLRVDLSDSTISEEAIPEGLYDQFLTGAGLATHYLYDEVPKVPAQLLLPNEIEEFNVIKEWLNTRRGGEKAQNGEHGGRSRVKIPVPHQGVCLSNISASVRSLMARRMFP